MPHAIQAIDQELLQSLVSHAERAGLLNHEDIVIAQHNAPCHGGACLVVQVVQHSQGVER
jgi:hypothetical protein